MTGEAILILSVLGWLLTLFGAVHALESFQKQRREKLFAKNRELLNDINKLLDDINL